MFFVSSDCSNKEKDSRYMKRTKRVIVLVVFFFAIGVSVAGIVIVVPKILHLNSEQPRVLSDSTQVSAIPKILLEVTGHDSRVTQSFTTNSDWNLYWTYSCSQFGHQGKFEVATFYSDGVITSLPSVNQFGERGSGVEHYQGAGSYYFAINSLCSWTVQVKE